jgi:hypothetical protein
MLGGELALRGRDLALFGVLANIKNRKKKVSSIRSTRSPFLLVVASHLDYTKDFPAIHPSPTLIH